MLEGWYCRTLANEQAAQHDEPHDPNMEINDDDSGSDDSQEQDPAAAAGRNASVDYKTQYRYLKRKLKFLIYENEFFQDALRSNQRRLLKVSRDRAFLLDRLLQYEKPDNTSSESDETDVSEDEVVKKRKIEQNTNGTNGGAPRGRKKKIVPTPVVALPVTENLSNITQPLTVAIPQTPEKPPSAVLEEQQGHMTAAEVERHLQSRQPVMELMPERAPATVPTEMFSNEPSLDSESNDHLIDGSLPTHVAAEECVPMEYSN